MNKKFKYGSLIAVLAVLMAVVTCVFAFSNPALAGVYVDGESNRYKESASSSVAGKFNVLDTDTNTAIVGYRFSVLEKNSLGTYDNNGSIDVFKSNPSVSAYNRHLKISVAGRTFYNLDKYSYKDKYSLIHSTQNSVSPEAFSSNYNTGSIIFNRNSSKKMI